MYKKESSSSSNGGIQEILLPKRLYLSIALLITLLMILGIIYFAYAKYLKPEKTDENLAGRVGKLIDLPSAEVPLIATVTDKEKLKEQSFFNDAQTGDKILIYKAAKMAYLYRPKSNKIIEVSAINSDIQPVASPSESTNLTSPSPSKTNEVKIAILNGTKTRGLASKTEKDLVKSFPQVNVTQTGNSKADYEKTIVVLLDSSLKKTAEDIAKSLKAEVATLPSGETKPKDAVILVILGEDRTT